MDIGVAGQDVPQDVDFLAYRPARIHHVALQARIRQFKVGRDEAQEVESRRLTLVAIGLEYPCRLGTRDCIRERLRIMIGGLATMVPERRDEIVSLGGKTIVSGTLATCISGPVVGVLY